MGEEGEDQDPQDPPDPHLVEAIASDSDSDSHVESDSDKQMESDWESWKSDLDEMEDTEEPQKMMEDEPDEADEAKAKDVRPTLISRMSTAQIPLTKIAAIFEIQPARVVETLQMLQSSLDQIARNSGFDGLVKRLMTDPQEFCCPISQQLMEDPVVASDGHTYDRSSMESSLQQSWRSPLTGLALQSKVLYPNQHLKSLILSYKESLVTEILSTAERLPTKVLLRAEEFVRPLLPDQSARRKLVTLLLNRMNQMISNACSGGPDPSLVVLEKLASEVARFIRGLQVDDDLHRLFNVMYRDNLKMVLCKLEDGMIRKLHENVPKSHTLSKSMIDQELACRLASGFGFRDDRCFLELWCLVSSHQKEWGSAAALLAMFFRRLKLSTQALPTETLRRAWGYVQDPIEAIQAAHEFFRSDLGLLNCWPEDSSCLLMELVIRKAQGETGKSPASLDISSLLVQLDDDSMMELCERMRRVGVPATSLVEKELACRLVFRMDLQKLWQLLWGHGKKDQKCWMQAAALVLATFSHAIHVDWNKVSCHLLLQASIYLDSQEDAIQCAQQFFNGDVFGLAQCRQWPPMSSARIWMELADRLGGSQDELSRLQLLVRAYDLNGKDIMIRSALTNQLHRCLLQPVATMGHVMGDHDIEALYLKLLLEDGAEIPTEVISKLSLQDVCLAPLLADQLLSLATQLGDAELGVAGACVAVKAATCFAADGREEESQDAYMLALRLDRMNADAAVFIEMAALELKKKRLEVKQLKETCDFLASRATSCGVFCWDLSIYDFPSFSKGQSVESGAFKFGSGNVWLWVYPKGFGGSRPDSTLPKCYLNVDQQVDEPVKIRLKFGRREVLLECDGTSGVFLEFPSLGDLEGTMIIEIVAPEA